MYVSIDRSKIVKDPKNKVTSYFIFEPHRRKNINNLKFHEDGPFSKRIFGNFYKCDCGELTEEGICSKCGTRVIFPKNMPDFYIDLEINVPVSLANFEEAETSKASIEDIEDILNYNKFYYDGEICELDENLNTSNYDQSKVLLGNDALNALGISKNWIDNNTVDYLGIPHTIYRPIVIDNSSNPFVTDINKKYSDIIKKINDVKELKDSKERPFYLMLGYREIARLYKEIISQLFAEIQDVKFSIIKSEIISHPISGAIRATLINRHDLDEDVLLIGDTLVETLWPYLYNKHNGDMALINEELVNSNALVLLNRPPTICHLSFISMKPRIASIYPYGKTFGTKRGLLHNYNYVEQNRDRIGLLPNQEGDIEKYGQGLDDGIDTCGLRCIAMNPIAFDGLAADTDGDVLFVIALYSNNAIEEARKILPSKSYINYANGTIRNHIIEDFIYVDEDE